MRTMHVPHTFPGLRLATWLLAAYFVIWIVLEGELSQTILLGAGTSIVALGHVAQRLSGGTVLGRGRWLALAAALGTLAGFSSAMLTLIFMAVKTGLHAHGPEFTVAEISWVLAQLPWWTTAGLLAGLGLGLIVAVMAERMRANEERAEG